MSSKPNDPGAAASGEPLAAPDSAIPERTEAQRVDPWVESLGDLMAVGGGTLEWRLPDSNGDCREGHCAQPGERPRLVSASWMPSTGAILGMDPDAPPTLRSALALIGPEDRRRILGMTRDSAKGGSFDTTIELNLLVGRKRWLRFAGSVASSPANPAVMTLLIQDVTDSRAREEELRRELRRQEQIARLANVGTWTVDLKTSELTWSDQVFRIHEMEPGPMPTVAEAVAFYQPEAAALVEEKLGALIRGEGVYDVVLPLVTAKGRPISVHAIGELETASDGTPLKLVGTFRDVTEEREAEAKLRASEERYMFALEGARDGIWDWDLATNQVHYSPRWKELLGYEDHEIANDFSEWESRVPKEDQGPALEALNLCLSGAAPGYRAEFRMRHKDGTWRWILARAKVVARDNEGKPLRMVGTHADITDQVELRKALITAKEAAESAASAKSNFLATMSHEIRTPMNGILGLTQVLLDTPMDKEQASHLRTIFDSGSALLQILNDILDLSKSEAEMLSLERKPFSPIECIKDTMALLERSVAAKPEVKLELRINDDVPDLMLGDAGRLRQVLMNLVGNALKFTEEGFVRAHVSSLLAADGGRDLRISIRDTGIGISREDANRLFEAFTQADSTTTRKFGGTGLGLSISRNLTHLMGGLIGCRPHANGGSVFWIEVPIEEVSSPHCGPGPRADRPKPAATEHAYSASPSAVPRGLRVLVVEDNAVNQLISKKMLAKLGCIVDVAENGLQAFDRTAETDYATVFMDCQMPIMDGYEATRLIRSREKQEAVRAPIPIVAMTANAMAGDREACLEAGMTDYVPKPILEADLRAALSRCLSDASGAEQRAV